MPNRFDLVKAFHERLIELYSVAMGDAPHKRMV